MGMASARRMGKDGEKQVMHNPPLGTCLQNARSYQSQSSTRGFPPHTREAVDSAVVSPFGFVI